MRVIEMDVSRRRRRHANISSITDGRIDSVTGRTQPAEHGAVYCRLHVDAERRMPLGRLFYNTSPQSPHHTLCRQQRREADRKKPLFFYAYKSFNRCNALIALEVLMAVSI